MWSAVGIIPNTFVDTVYKDAGHLKLRQKVENELLQIPDRERTSFSNELFVYISGEIDALAKYLRYQCCKYENHWIWIYVAYHVAVEAE
jgi:hypothetical protein